MSADAGILPDLPDFPGKARNLGLLCERSRLLNVKSESRFDILETLWPKGSMSTNWMNHETYQ